MVKRFEIENLLITIADESDITDIFNLQRAAYQSEAEIYNDYSIQPLTLTAILTTTRRSLPYPSCWNTGITVLAQS